jgi:hypothetical protein
VQYRFNIPEFQILRQTEIILFSKIPLRKINSATVYSSVTNPANQMQSGHFQYYLLQGHCQ